MQSPYDLETVKEVLRAATGPKGRFSQRSLSAAAGEGRDCVGDILNGRNRNPTGKVLANLAQALGTDVSVFGMAPTRIDIPTADDLERALLDMLPGMPRGSLDRRARYLAEGVARALRLPPSRQATPEDAAHIADHGEAAPPPLATS